MRATAVLCVRNEGAFLLEWIAHHRMVGFSDVLIYSNDCEDGTDVMLDRLQSMGLITHIRNSGPYDRGQNGDKNAGPQWAMLRHAAQHSAVQSADWACVLDIDELVNIHTGARRLPDLIAALPNADAIAMTWRLFGNGGHVQMQDAPVTQTFTRAAPATLGWPWRAQMFKTLFKGPNFGHYTKLGVHRPQGLRAGAQPRWFDGSGRALGDGFVTSRVFSDYTQNNYALVQLNHYPLGAVENYLVKADRGRANRDLSSFDMGYWIERNLNEAMDTTITALDSSDLRAQLHSDPVLGDLHRAAFAWRRARFAALMQQEPWRALYGRLRMAPPSRSLSVDEAREITRHSPQA
jgi:hypothetical protein